METQTRLCKKCNITKPLSEFAKYERGHRHRCIECNRNYYRAYTEKNKDKLLEQGRASYRRLKADPDWHKRRLEKRRSWDQPRFIALRDEVLAAYGGPKCACCGITEPKFLSLDHINNDGYQMRKIHGLGSNLYRWVKKNGFPPIFQVLCMNCNHGKSRNGGICPHQRDKEGSTTISQESTPKRAEAQGTPSG